MRGIAAGGENGDVPRCRPETTLRIVPDPPQAEREAIAAALARVTRAAGAPGGRTAWWREGVRESIEPAELARRRPGEDASARRV